MLRNRLLALFGSICLVLILTVMFFVACAGPSPSPSPSPTPSPSPSPSPTPSQTPEEEEETQPAAPFYEGKGITVVCPYGVGGGTDLFARVVTGLLGKYIPGNPPIVIKNMLVAPGIGGANYVYNTAPKDGTFLIATGGATVAAWLSGQPEASYDFAEFVPVSSACMGIVFYGRSGLVSGEPGKIISPDEIDWPRFFNEIVPASSWGAIPGALLDAALYFAWTNEAGYLFDKVVTAYQSGDGPFVDVLAGRLDIAETSSVKFHNSIAPLVEQGEIQPLFQLGIPDPEGKIIREDFGILSEIPTLAEVYMEVEGKEWPTTARLGAIQRAYVATAANFRTLAFAPGVPSERVEILRNAYSQMVETAEFQELKARVLGEPLLRVGGMPLEVTKEDRDALGELVELVREAYGLR